MATFSLAAPVQGATPSLVLNLSYLLIYGWMCRTEKCQDQEADWLIQKSNCYRNLKHSYSTTTHISEDLQSDMDLMLIIPKSLTKTNKEMQTWHIMTKNRHKK